MMSNSHRILYSAIITAKKAIQQSRNVSINDNYIENSKSAFQ